MAQQTRAQIEALINSNVTTNANRENTGLRVNQLLQEMKDSYLNLLSDAGKLFAAYDPALNYVPGNIVEESTNIYKCNTATTGAFNVAHWDVIGGASGANYEELTHADLKAKVDGSTLIPGRLYLMTDFTTKYQIVNTAVIDESAVFKIAVKSIQNNRLEPTAFSPDFVQDIFQYDVNDVLCEDSVTPRKGKITFRFDTVKNISAWYDWRNIQFRRWQSNGYKHDVVTKDTSSTCSVTATTGTANVNNPATVYEEYLLDFTAFTVHDASPQLTVSDGADSLQKELKKYSGGTVSSLGANELNTFLTTDKVAYVYYSPANDCYVCINDQSRHDLLKAKNVGITASNPTIGNGYEVLLTATTVDQLTFDNVSDPPIKDVHIGKTSQNNGMNNIVWHTNTGIDGTTIGNECYNISFGGKTECLHMGDLCYNNMILTDIGFSNVRGELYNMIIAGVRFAYSDLEFTRNMTIFLNTTAVYNKIRNAKDSTLRWTGGTAGQMTYNEMVTGVARSYIYWEAADRNVLLTTTDTVWEAGANWTACFFVTTKPGTRTSINLARTNNLVTDVITSLNPAASNTATDFLLTIDANGDITATTLTPDMLNNKSQDMYFVGKHGSDTNDGKSWNTAFLTFAKALTVGIGDIIVCLDNGDYDEGGLDFSASINSIYAPHATFRNTAGGNYTIKLDLNGRDQYIGYMFGFSGKPTLLINSTTNNSTVFVSTLICGGGATGSGVEITGAGGVSLHIGNMNTLDGVAIRDNSTPASSTFNHHLEIGQITVNLNGTGVKTSSDANARLTGKIGTIKKQSGATGTKGVDIVAGNFYADVDVLEVDTAWVSTGAGEMRGKINKFIGTHPTFSTSKRPFLSGDLVKNFVEQTAAPTVNDDNTKGATTGSMWYDSTNKKVYVCTNAATGAAVWVLLGASSPTVAYVPVYWDRGTSVNSPLYCFWRDGKRMNSQFTPGLNQSALAPFPAPWAGTIGKRTILFNALATDSGSSASTLTLKCELWKIGGSTEGTKLGDMNIVFSKGSLTIGTFQDTSANQAGKASDSNSAASFSEGDGLAFKYIDGTGTSQIKAHKDLFLIVELIKS